MQDRIWPEAIRVCADPKRAEQGLRLLRATEAAAQVKSARAEQARVLTALLSGSQAQTNLLLSRPQWLADLLRLERLRHPRGYPALRTDLTRRLGASGPSGTPSLAFAEVRQFKQRELLRIAARDLARLGGTRDILRELSDLADVCLEAVYELCRAQMEQRAGSPWHLDTEEQWQPTGFCVLGMGKLGGQELNYSSDVDLLFVYSEEGSVFREPPRPGELGHGMTNHQYFRRLAEMFITEVSRTASDGALYRIDMRLRPEGTAGPLVRSLDSYESYYWQWGQTWERMMLIKARRIAGNSSLAGEFLEVVQAFRYPRSLNRQALEDIAAMKRRIESEVVRAGEIHRNVKLGRGGIREIEFVAQTLQILNAGRHPFLANPQTLPALDKLVEYNLLAPDTADTLRDAYLFLRDVEHRLQMDNNLQTHTIPTDRASRERLARLMDCDNLRAFETRLDQHRERVRHIYEQWFQPDEPEPAADLPDIENDEASWRALLANHSLRDPDRALRLVRGFLLGPGFGHVSARTEQFARDLMARLLALCPRQDQPLLDHARRFPDGEPQARRLSDPDRVLARLDTFIAAYRGRALLFETWATNPSLFQLLVLLFDRSEFLAETAIRTPDLVDELELSGYLRRTKTADQTLRDLRHGRQDEDQRLWLRRYHKTELMRIGLREILGLADFEQNLTELSALADACLQYALEVILHRHQIPGEPLAIVGLGKLGGAELNYGSDLDIVFVADDKARRLPELQRVASDVLELVGSTTELGIAFEIDTRLRPDGEKGLLVNTLHAYGEYYRLRARLWELQAIARSRLIAGNPALGTRFQTLVTQLTSPAALAAKDPDWQREIARMRLRIEKERTPRGKEALAIKTGAGGLVDAEFIAQTLGLKHGWQEPNTLRALRLARDRDALPPNDADRLIDNYRQLRRIECVLRRWSYEAESELPDDPAPLYRVAVRCGFANADDFMAAVRRYRENIRSVYTQLMGS